jgi:dihydrofolate reductase
MRSLIFAINLTLDGCCDHTKAEGREEVLQYFTHLLRESDALVYGRKTYELMVPYWPDVARNPAAETTASKDFAQAFAAVERIIVFSRSLDGVTDRNTRIARADLREEILTLKSQPGRSILTGGVDLPSQLMALDLIDEYRVVVHPLLAGQGRRLWDGVDLAQSLRLSLVESRSLGSGCVALRYLRQGQQAQRG